jgi:hypothetical protein
MATATATAATSAEVSAPLSPPPQPRPAPPRSNNNTNNDNNDADDDGRRFEFRALELRARLESVAERSRRMLSPAQLYAQGGADEDEDDDDDEEEGEVEGEEGEEEEGEALANFLAPPLRPRSAAAARAADTRDSAAHFSGDLDLLLYVRWFPSSSSSAGSRKTRLFELELAPLASLGDLPPRSRSALSGAFPPRAPPPAAAAAAAAAAPASRRSNGNGNGTISLDADAAALAAAAAVNEAMRRGAQQQRQQQQQQPHASTRAAFPPSRPPAAAAAGADARSSSSSTLPAHLSSPDFYRFAPREEFFTPPGDTARLEFTLVASPRAGDSGGWEVPLLANVPLGTGMRSGDARECPLLVTVVESSQERVVAYGPFGIRYAVAQVAFPVVSVARELLDAAARRLLAKMGGEEEGEGEGEGKERK